MNPPPTQEPKGTRAWRAKCEKAGGGGVVWATSESKARYKAVLAIGDVHPGITFADVHVARASEYDGLEDEYEDGTSEDYITISNPTTMKDITFEGLHFDIDEGALLAYATIYQGDDLAAEDWCQDMTDQDSFAREMCRITSLTQEEAEAFFPEVCIELSQRAASYMYGETASPTFSPQSVIESYRNS